MRPDIFPERVSTKAQGNEGYRLRGQYRLGAYVFRVAIRVNIGDGQSFASIFYYVDDEWRTMGNIKAPKGWSAKAFPLLRGASQDGTKAIREYIDEIAEGMLLRAATALSPEPKA